MGATPEVLDHSSFAAIDLGANGVIMMLFLVNAVFRGAGKPERAKASVWRAAYYNVIFLGMIGAFFVVFAEVITGAFTSDPQVAPIAARGLRIISAGFPFYAAGYVLTQSFNGAGDTMTPTLINILCLWLGEIPLAYVLARSAGFAPPACSGRSRSRFR
jgi:Na+-driven multidrug efflux pump